ncbi:MAG: bacillithiol biosynthesis cysteine-adding enzyme BshC [bacterium]|jgi:bacillithiol biosynthesis cysteine-adding enzyme BshC
MSIQHIPYKNTGYFSSLMVDYLAKREALASFYHRFPSMENFKAQLEEKSASFSTENRNVLVASLNKQYQDFSISEATQSNIDSLLSENTFTITTGHQLNLFTGPLYFLYKIVSVINLSEQLNKKHSNHHFVPVYWMATEDHDFDEVNYFNLYSKKVAWNHESGGAVGELETDGLETLLAILKTEIGASENAKKLTDLFSEAYLKHNKLSDATRYLANQLFAEYGLVIIDGNHSELKKEFAPFVKNELLDKDSFSIINKTTDRLEAIGYNKQVHPREINLFYIIKGIRERIIEEEGTYEINNTTLVFTKEEILKELQEFPERFSPNALLRPLFQEVVLPNLCYVGGGGELAYWFQLKDYFKSVAITFPILLLRNSVLLVLQKLAKKLEKLNETIEALFLNTYDLEKKHTLQLSALKIDFTPQREHLKKQFEDLYELAKQTDISFLGAVGAQEKKQLNGLDYLEKRLLKAEKRKLKDQIERLIAIQEQLFPRESLQERTVNFSEFYLEYGDDLIPQLKKQLDPLCHEFTVLYL